jgi:acetyl-CoA acetyltransferase family protein
MSRAPYVQLKSDRPFDRRPPAIADTTVGWRFVNPRMNPDWTISLGATADLVAQRYGISRAEQDAFALQSQKRAAAALDRGVFDDEIVAVQVPRRKGEPLSFAVDEHPRPGITADKLARLGPAFGAEGTVTAGSSSGINDGAAALVVAGPGALPGQRPLARIIGCAVAGVSPEVMGLGPIPATRRLLRRTGLSVDEIELIELNEAFAAQSLACIRELSLDPQRVNIYGGAIALGHPLGCTGAKILVTLVHALRREDKRLGLATMCIGVGQGIAMIIERVE